MPTKKRSNAREWMDAPPDTVIDTKAGQLWICVNGPGRGYFFTY